MMRPSTGDGSPQFVDRFVQRWLHHEIPVFEHVLLVGGGDVTETVQQAVQPSQRILLGHVGELRVGKAGVTEFDQSGGPVQPPPPLRHGRVDFGIVGVGQLGETVGGLRGQVEAGRGPVAHGAGSVTGIHLIVVQLADQDDLAGPEAGDGSFHLNDFFLPGVDLLFDGSGLSPPFHQASMNGGYDRKP